MIRVCVIAMLMAPPVMAAKSDMQAAVGELTATSDDLTADVVSAFIRLRDGTNMNKGVLLVGAVVETKAGKTIDWPVTLIPTAFPVGGFQVDVVLPADVMVDSIVAGPVLAPAGKVLQNATVTTGRRLIVFGVNQATIGQGVTAVLKLKVDTNLLPGDYPIGMVNPVMSTPSGASIIVSAVSGTIRVVP